MRTALRVLGLFVFVALASCGGSKSNAPDVASPSAPKVDTKETRNVKTILSRYENAQITYYEIDGRSDQVPTRPGPRLHGYLIEQEVKVTDPKMLKVIHDALTDPKSYDDGKNAYKCFEPGMAIRYQVGERMVDFIICLGCGHMYSNFSPEKDAGDHWFINPEQTGFSKVYELFKKSAPSKPSSAPE